MSLLYDGPIARLGHVVDPTPIGKQQIDDRIQTILDVRRGADLLLARADVDPARRDRIKFLHQQLHLGPINWDAVAKVPQLVQPPQPKQ